MAALEFKDACHSFAEAAAPYLPIQDKIHYDEVLAYIESLLEEVDDSLNDPLNTVITMLSDAIRVYENNHEELVAFETRAMEGPADLAMLRLLMDQHQLGTADLPEIGSKSMVSRVLSGERSINKNHIEALSQRFGIEPGLFF